MSSTRTKISPRIRIRDVDVNSTRPFSVNDGLLPPPSRGIRSIAAKMRPFNDTSTIVFDQSEDILYPVMLPQGHPNVNTTGIVALGRPTPGSSDIHENISAVPSLPFLDVASSHSTSFYLDPTPGMPQSFRGPLSSRMSIRVDITSLTGTYMYRCPQRHINSDPTEFTQEGTGFYYYNFEDGGWDGIGNVDPETGAALKTDQAANAFTSSAGEYPPIDVSTITSSVYYTGQFIPPNHVNQRGMGGSLAFTQVQQLGFGITKIGTPTATFLAPGASKYHAKSDNVLRMSDYITQPFLLEKIKIEIPIIARRIHGSSSYYNPAANSYAANDLHCRDMDNYVVFLYRQVRNAQPIAYQSGSLFRDSPADVSGSDRFLIGSASICFYNSPSYESGLFGTAGTTTANGFPFHTPAFKHDFNTSVASGLGSNPPTVTMLYTGSVTLEITPSIYTSGLGGASYFPSTMSNSESVGSITNRDGWRINYIQHAWPGSAGSLAIGDSAYAGSSDYSGKTTGNLAGTARAQFKTYESTSSLSPLTSSYTTLLNVTDYLWTTVDLERSRSRVRFFNPTQTQNSLFNPDPRSFMSIFGPTPQAGKSQKSLYTPLVKPSTTGNPRFIGGAAQIAGESVKETPIILLPGDELILGIDAGIAPFMRDSSSITGSFLKIENRRATLTLYGSQVVNGERRQNVSSQQSKSNAVFRSDADDPILDEFLLDPLQTTMRNYHAPLATGSFPDRTRQSTSGFVTNYKLTDDYVDWWKYPRQVVMLDDRSSPIDAGVYPRFVFRNDKFGQPAHMLQASQALATKTAKATKLPGSKKGGTMLNSYPVTNVFTGSTSFSGNTSLHATSSVPFSDSE